MAVITITGFGKIEAAVEAIKLGAVDYLTKPIVDEELLIAVGKALQQHALLAENQTLRSQLAQRFGLDGLVCYADEMPVGFLLAQRIAPSVSVMRFAKGIDSHKGIYQYMFHHYCMSRSQDVEWLNFEQDLGLANFRQTKRSYQPSSMLGKYRVHLQR